MPHDILVFSVLGLVEGLTEFLPISSSGHLIVAHRILGAADGNALAVDAVLQLGAILAVVVYFFKDLWRLSASVLGRLAGKPIPSEDVKLILALILGTIPAVILGLFLESTMDSVFRNTHLVAYALIAGSFVLIAAEYFSKRKATENVGVRKSNIVRAKDGLLVGLWQALALVPGMSRSGMTIAGGLFLGMTRESAARFGFLLSIPIILGSGAKKFIELSQSGAFQAVGLPLLGGTFIAFISGLLAIHGLLRFLRSNPLYIFAFYRIILAAIILFFIPA